MPLRAASCRVWTIASVAALALVAGCSTPKQAPTPPPPVVRTIKPLPPMGAVEDMSIPEVDAEGKYLTPNRGVTANTALWHVRMALNVAALSCHGAGEPARIQYNKMLHVHKDILREANAAVDRNYTAAYGSAGLQSRELLNTVVYNFFSLPPVTKSFCPVAVDVGAKILAMPSSQLLAYAPEALTALEKPFQEFYEAYADYLRRLAEWQSRFGGTVTVIVSPTPLPPPPKPPAEISPGFVPPPALPPLREESGQALVPGATSAPRVNVPTFPIRR
ncbi:hypothetical protein FIM10_06055 [Sphingomonadales bacterium 56]|nr:hypothetical protein [Sphingomonadales bacterium 56]MBY2958336.1 hypothetical protein [Sphingomonadales bacterium 58]